MHFLRASSSFFQKVRKSQSTCRTTVSKVVLVENSVHYYCTVQSMQYRMYRYIRYFYCLQYDTDSRYVTYLARRYRYRTVRDQRVTMWKNTVKLEIQKTQHKKCDLGLTNLTELEEMEAARTAVEADNDNDLRVPCFCEENVWRLAYRLTHRPRIKKGLQYHVVFVSNPVKCVPMFQQLANSNPLDPVYWDYHVILFQTLEADGTRVLDIDSHLPYKLTLCDYLKSVFPNWNQWRKTYLPYFR